MRWFAPLLLVALAARADVPEPVYKLRAWKGFVRVRSLSRERADQKGREAQEEEVTFTIVTLPPNKAKPWMAFEARASAGSWRLILNRQSGSGGNAVRTRGEDSGRLHVAVDGMVDPRTNRYVLRLQTSPQRFVITATMSGIEEGRLQTFRTGITRNSFLAGFKAEGQLEQDGRLLRGKREFVDRNKRLPRDVVILWEMRRVDAVVAGRVRDQLGRPVVGARVFARHTTAARVRKGLPPIVKEAATDKAGRFSMKAFLGWWSVRVEGFESSGVLFEGGARKDPIELKFDDSPQTEIEMKAYMLRALPTPRLLHRHFRGNVDQYLNYIRPRARRGEMQRALVAPPAER